MESAVAARLTEVGPCQVCLAREGMSRLKGLGGWPMLSSGRKSGWPALLAFFARGRGFWSRSMTTRLEDFVFLVVTACSSVTARVLTREYCRSYALGTEEISASGWHSFRYLQLLSPRATAGNRVRARHLCDYVGKSTQLIRVLRDRICRHARTRSSAV